MASFRESIDDLKEAGLADSEILKIMSDSVNGQTNFKTTLNKNKSGYQLPKIDKNINAATHSVRKSPNHLGKLPRVNLGKRGDPSRTFIQPNTFPFHC